MLWTAPPGATAHTRLDLREFKSATFTSDTDLDVPGDAISFTGEGALVRPDAVQFRLRLRRQTIEMIRIGQSSFIRSTLLGGPSQWYTTDADSSTSLNVPGLRPQGDGVD